MGCRIIKYPKFLLLALTFIAAYLLFIGSDFIYIRNLLLPLGYFGIFLAGVFYAYGFTAAPATAILLIFSKGYNILLAGFIAGVGALIADLIIFKFVRHSFADEIEKLLNEKIILKMGKIIPPAIKKYFIPVCAGFIIASPLPDEIGATLFAMSRNVSTKAFSIISYILNTFGIFIILFLGNNISG